MSKLCTGTPFSRKYQSTFDSFLCTGSVLIEGRVNIWDLEELQKFGEIKYSRNGASYPLLGFDKDKIFLQTRLIFLFALAKVFKRKPATCFFSGGKKIFDAQYWGRRFCLNFEGFFFCLFQQSHEAEILHLISLHFRFL